LQLWAFQNKINTIMILHQPSKFLKQMVNLILLFQENIMVALTIGKLFPQQLNLNKPALNVTKMHKCAAQTSTQVTSKQLLEINGRTKGQMEFVPINHGDGKTAGNTILAKIGYTIA